jgi:uncharacterized NAD-dependent epimerase/dehydratase family protein
MNLAHSTPGISSSEPRQLILLTDGHSNPLTAKTATSMLRYCRNEVVALFDRSQVGKSAEQLLGVGKGVPVVGELAAAPEANGLMIGIAPPGGRIPEAWRPVVLEAIGRKMTIYSGLHEFLGDDPQFASVAAQHGATLVDVRKNSEHQVAQYGPLRDQCLRIHTVGNDCSVGKMVVAIELAGALEEQGHDAQFIATGQTGILIAGEGCPVDCVVGDFISGAIEKQVVAQQHHELLLIEGQGCLAHPRYAAVTLGLLHGCRPQALILCYEVGRTVVHGMPEVPLKSLAEICALYETMASLLHPSRVIGIAMNSRSVSAAEAQQDRQRVREELGLPVCDVLRHGPDDLVQAIRQFQQNHLQDAGPVSCN